MHHAVRSRATTLRAPAPAPAAGPSPAAAPAARPRRVRSLIDADALRVLHRAARTLLDDLPGLTDRLVTALKEHEPAYRAAIDHDPAANWREVHRSLRHSVTSLIDPRGARESARRCSWTIGTARAEQGIPLDALLHAFRLGGSLVWQQLVDETSRTAPEDVRLLVHVASDVWNFVDDHCALVADAYRQTERQLTRRRENRVRLLAGALLDGTSRVVDLPDTAHALDLPEHGRYVVVAVTGGHLPPGARARAAALPHGTRVHWHTGAHVDYGIVLTGDGDDGPSLPADTPPGVRIGIGGAVDGLAGVKDARRSADTALRICPGEGGTVRLRDHLAAALVVSSPALGTTLVTRVLGPLLCLEPADRDVLLDTLAAWLACDGSAQRAGARLYCHRNTVLNRLRRCEQLTGRSLARPADVVDISLALTAHRLLRD